MHPEAFSYKNHAEQSSYRNFHRLCEELFLLHTDIRTRINTSPALDVIPLPITLPITEDGKVALGAFGKAKFQSKDATFEITRKVLNRRNNDYQLSFRFDDNSPISLTVIESNRIDFTELEKVTINEIDAVISKKKNETMINLICFNNEKLVDIKLPPALLIYLEVGLHIALTNKIREARNPQS